MTDQRLSKEKAAPREVRGASLPDGGMCHLCGQPVYVGEIAATRGRGSVADGNWEHLGFAHPACLHKIEKRRPDKD